MCWSIMSRPQGGAETPRLLTSASEKPAACSSASSGIGADREEQAGVAEKVEDYSAGGGGGGGANDDS